MTWLLDTNAVSELRKVQAGKGDPGVAAWQAGVPRVELYLSAVTVMEPEMGAPQMERKDTDQGAFGPGRVIMKRSACGVCRPLPHSPAPPPPWRWMWRGPLGGRGLCSSIHACRTHRRPAPERKYRRPTSASAG